MSTRKLQNPLIRIAFALIAAVPPAGFANPVILNHSIDAGAGALIALQGDDFGSTPEVWLSANGGPYSQVATLNSGANTATAQIPFTATGLCSVFVRGVTGDSAPVNLNSAVGYHFDMPEAAPGDAFRIIGRDLLLPGFSPRVDLVNSSSGTAYTASVGVNSTSYILSVTVPDSIPLGTYDVWVSNGSGDWDTVKFHVQFQMIVRAAGVDHWNLGAGWAKDLSFYNNVYNVLSDPRLTQHAVGDGVNNDLAAINAAIVKANADGGGVVYLPMGIYKLQNTSGDLITLLSKVVLQGQGMDSTIIKYGYGTPAAGSFALRFTFNSTLYGVADLQLCNVNELGTYTNNPIYTSSGSPSNRFFLSNVKHIKSTEGSSSFTGDRYAIKGCVISGYTGPLFVSGTNFLVKANTITYSANTALGMNASSTAQPIGPGIVEDNTIQPDLSATTNLGVRHSIAANFDADVLFANNTIASINGAGIDNNDVESINSEGGGATRPGESTGTVVSASGNTVTVSNSGTFTAGAVMCIVNGKGRGQWQKITNWSGTTVTLAGNWAVTPDSSSSYSTFKWSLREVTILGNQFSNVPRGVWLYTGSSTDVVIAQNTFSNADGIYMRPDQRLATGRFNVIYNTQALDNVLSDTTGTRPAYVTLTMYQVNPTTTLGTGALNVEIRRNSITGSGVTTFPSTSNPYRTEGYGCSMVNQSGSYSDQGVPAVLGTILQWNRAVNIATANFYLNTASYYSAVANNPLTTSAQVNDTTLSGAPHASVGTFFRSPPNVTVSGPAGAAQELGSVPASFSLSRSGPLEADVAINVSVAGTATAGVDYPPLPTTKIIPAGSSSITIPVNPVSDALPEGDESVVLYVTPDALGNYAVSGGGTATLTVKDLPADDWRFNNFTPAQLLDPSISGDTAKPDGVANLVKYALTITPGPLASAALPRPQVRTYLEGDRLALVFTRDAARADVTISVEAANTPLGPWTAVAASANGGPFSGSGFVSETNLTGTLKQVEVRDIVNRSGAASRVMRVSVTR